jgi:hypothetical protein
MFSMNNGSSSRNSSSVQTGCSSQSKKSKNWTLLFYTSEDEKIESAAPWDVSKLLFSGNRQHNVAVVWLLETPKYGSWLISAEGTAQVDRAPCRKGLRLSDPDTLSDFIKNSIELFPADNYALFLQGHGGGWYLEMADGKCISVSQLTGILQSALHAKGVKNFEILAFDNCYMSTIETVYQVRELTNYIVACEDASPDEGLVDVGLLEMFGSNQTTEDILGFMVKQFVARNDKIPEGSPGKTEEKPDPADVTVIATRYLNGLKAFLQSLQFKLQSALNNVDPSFLRDRAHAVDRDYYKWYQVQDLGSLVQALLSVVPASESEAGAASEEESELWDDILGDAH